MKFIPTKVDGFMGYSVKVCNEHPGEDKCDHLHIDENRHIARTRARLLAKHKKRR